MSLLYSNNRAKTSENVYKEFLNWGLEIGQIDWYNKLTVDNFSSGGTFMKKMKVSAIMVPLAAAGCFLRRLVYMTAVDAKNLIISGHPAVTALWVLTAAALVLAVAISWKQKGNSLAGANSLSFLGHGILATGMALAALLNPIVAPGVLGSLWKVLALAGAVCLLPAGFDRMRGKSPFFAFYAVPALFFLVNVVAHYQIWCSNPQFTDYAFALLGSVMLALHSYQMAALSLEEGNQKILVLTGLAAVYLCAAELFGSIHPYLYLGGALFALTNLET